MRSKARNATSNLKRWCEDNGQDYYADRVRVTKTGNSSLQSSSSGFTMNLQLFARKSSDYETVHLPADEYATVMHEINTNLSAEDRSKKVVTKAIGDYYYSFENNGFGSYRIFRKKPIDE